MFCVGFSVAFKGFLIPSSGFQAGGSVFNISGTKLLVGSNKRRR